MDVSLWCEEVEPELQQPPRAPWDPSVSGQRVIHRLLQVEQRYLPPLLYVSLVQRAPERREELAKWALEVCCECCCAEAVFPLAVSLLDRFLSTSLAPPLAPPLLLVASCVLIASKLTESHSVAADSLCASAEYDFLPADLREMERLVLATLRWDTAAVTPQDFLPLFLDALQEGGPGGAGPEASALRRHSDTLAAMCACDARFLGAPPSLVAAAALNCALRGLGTRSHGHQEGALAELCRTDLVVLQCYSEMVEVALSQRLGRSLQQRPAQKGEEVEDERAGTPTDMRDIDF
ncbi:cyclin Dx [Nelusetta ayraudi]|uniref:cyclin Dx n=1 Tax=Nelusetta ayraudi TaxID=303726 RepID=UPI003F71DEE7